MDESSSSSLMSKEGYTESYLKKHIRPEVCSQKDIVGDPVSDSSNVNDWMPKSFSSRLSSKSKEQGEEMSADQKSAEINLDDRSQKEESDR